jgi:uncharacterized protein with HEPN domain
MIPEPMLVPDYLRHVLDAIQRIRTYVEGISEKDFYSDQRTQDAVIRNIEVMGEAARNAQLCGQDVPEIRDGNQLGRAYRMRNKLAHGYFSIDLSVIWRTVQEDMPALEHEVRELYDRLKK